MRKPVAVLVSCLGLAAIVVAGASLESSAAAVKSAVITGYVMECGPGPIVQSPPAPPPSPKPATVTVMHDGHRYARESIRFPTSPPWSGSFSFNVAAGRYEVISTYYERSRWVNVKSGSRTVVSFSPFACPL
ncbi:MAG TPA: hypothetical protein VGZ04_06425 [Acidimicrobiales bacterium]|jgi:hypothetical protein|nr:hypothetical protein [Acidimicrobiales bacterium]